MKSCGVAKMNADIHATAIIALGLHARMPHYRPFIAHQMNSPADL